MGNGTIVLMKLILVSGSERRKNLFLKTKEKIVGVEGRKRVWAG